MKSKKYFVLIFLSLALMGCSQLQPIMAVENAEVTFNLPVSSVKKAILEAGAQRDWIMTETSPGIIRGDLSVRSHKAVIEITFNDKAYSINYVNSENLKYSDGKIHRNYNRWINNLSLDIRKKLSILAIAKE